MRPRTTRAAAARALAPLALSLAALACEAPPPPVVRPPIPPAPDRDRAVAEAYPTLAEIYQGAQGIYRGCGPNGNVCHNARQYPNLNTLGAVALNINQPCNQLQDDPTRMDDWCERQGDTVRAGDARLVLGYIQRLSEATETQGSRWAVVVQGTFPELPEDAGVSIVRVRPDGGDTRLINFEARHLARDPSRPDAILVQLAPDDQSRERALARAGIPAERDAIQFGDANRNGVYGVGLGNGLIVAGHPERSYLIRRMVDPSAGPLMPLANCCFWSKASLRALWCWIASLNPDGSNALDPIDYRVCPDGPTEDVEYPTPGPTCENAGLCPVHARTPVPNEPTWSNVYGNVFVPRCGGNGCHRGESTAGGLDLGTSDVAYEQLLGGPAPRVVPGNPSGSLLYQRLTQPCAAGATCRRMPLGQSALPAHTLSVVARWIENGAPRDGVPFDGGVMDAGGMDADGMDAGGMDAGGMDAGDPRDAEPADVPPPDAAAEDAPVGPDAEAPDAGGADAMLPGPDVAAD